MFDFFLYLISILLVLSSFFVIFSRNPVQSVLFLVLVFCLVAQLLILLQVDFLAFILVIVYVGAIAVLFLFVVMMLNIKIVELTETVNQYLPAGLFLSLVILMQLLVSVSSFKQSFQYSPYLDQQNWFETSIFNSNIINLGAVLYTHYAFFLIFAGLLLLLAMIGAITLTLNLDENNSSLKKQSITVQVSRQSKDLNFWKNISNK